jgi:hypothetical protein
MVFKVTGTIKFLPFTSLYLFDSGDSNCQLAYNAGLTEESGLCTVTIIANGARACCSWSRALSSILLFRRVAKSAYQPDI